MINYSAHKILNFSSIQFYNTIKRVRKYKNFVPWCTDSWEANKTNQMMTVEKLIESFPQLKTNPKSYEMLLSMKDPMEVQIFDGGIKVGFNVLDFSYVSKVVTIEPNIVLSLTDSSNSNIFKTLESLWIVKNIPQSSNISVDYEIKFEFKSVMFRHVTNMFLHFLGDNILKAFIKKCNEEKTHSPVAQTSIERKINELILYKLDRMTFESKSDKRCIKDLLVKLYDYGDITYNDAERIICLIGHNKTFLRNLVFLSELVEWSNAVSRKKITDEVFNYKINCL